MPDFIPSREADLPPYTLNIAVRAAAEPVALGLNPLFVDEYVAAQALFTTLLNAMGDPGTRTPAKRIAKDAAKKQLIAKTRELARIVQANPYVTDETRGELGLTVPKPRTSQGRPTTRPVLMIDSVTGRDVGLRFQGEDARRARPAGTKGAFIFWAAGDTAPTDPAAWTWDGLITKLTAVVRLPDTLATEARVWFTASWVNDKGETGPGCEPIGTYLNKQGSPVTAAPSLKIAA